MIRKQIENFEHAKLYILSVFVFFIRDNVHTPIIEKRTYPRLNGLVGFSLMGIFGGRLDESFPACSRAYKKKKKNHSFGQDQSIAVQQAKTG